MQQLLLLLIAVAAGINHSNASTTMPRPPFSSPFQLLEINLISAQDLAAASKSMRTFAVAWVNSKRKLTTRVDQNGHTNPTWNEKFVFRVDEDFIKDDTSKIMIEIYASAWLRDVLIGTAAVVVSNLQNNSKMRFMAIQLRRPSGRPQGILNVGLGLLDNTMRSMPLYSELSASAVGYWDIMDGKSNKKSPQNNLSKMDDKLLIFQRSQSERTTSDFGFSKSKPASSIGNAGNNFAKKPPGSICIGSSIVNGSELSSAAKSGTPKGGKSRGGTPKSGTKNINNPTGNGSMVNGGSLCSDVGPSPSVVAAAIAKGIYPLPHGASHTESGSSLMDEWADEDSVEGLKTKIERWRTELPPVYDTKNSNQNLKVLPSTHRSTRRKSRRSRSTGGGLFSCFALGCEISISCGGKGKPKKKSSGKVHLSPSEVTYDDDSYVR